MTTWIEWALVPENKSSAVASILEYYNWMERLLVRSIKRNERWVATSEYDKIKKVLIKGIKANTEQLAAIRRERDELVAYAKREGIPLPPRSQSPRERHQFSEGLR